MENIMQQSQVSNDPTIMCVYYDVCVCVCVCVY